MARAPRTIPAGTSTSSSAGWQALPGPPPGLPGSAFHQAAARRSRGCAPGPRSDLEGRQLALHRQVLQTHVGGQAVLERGDVLTLDQRRQVLAAGVGNVEAVLADELAGHELLDVGHLAQGSLDD